MDDFFSSNSKDGFSMKLWRGERMCLVGFDVDNPEPDFVGFAIECKEPKSTKFTALLNRIAFSYDKPLVKAVTGAKQKQFPSTKQPFQKFRWVHFPHNPKDGKYTYRATKMHMPKDDVLKKGTSITLSISLEQITYHDFLDIGFTRNFASSQAFRDKFPADADMDAIGRQIIPDNADAGLSFRKMKGKIYEWMGFEAYDLIFEFLDEAVKDKTITLDVFAYDLNEPDIVARLEKLGPRLRAIIDDSTSKNKKTSVVTGHGTTDSAESQAAARLRTSAGAANIKRTHFQGLQHHKVFIAKRNGVAFKVSAGSTNFSFRGVYIQANNVLIFTQPDIAALYSKVFDAAFADPGSFSSNDLARNWNVVQAADQPPVSFCFSPHKSSDLSLNPVRGAIDGATSSVLYSIAFLNLIKSGPTKDALDRLMKRPIFSYGAVNEVGKMEIRKPDGSTGMVDFAFLAKTSPEPFKSEWSGGQGINIHHKFVVTDFSLPTATVFTGSSNLAPSGENGNGDHLIKIEDQKVATSYAIEAVRVFDHLHFRTLMKEVFDDPKNKPAKKAATKGKEKQPDKLVLQKPTAISGKKNTWFDRFYVVGSLLAGDRKLFSK
jgi:phosphatidylserine/phosphatidylglycerophosphate/cardiolipin synthase-like enzyme